MCRLPFSLGELVVLAVLVIGVKVDDALNKVLIEHLWVLLQEPIHQTVLTKPIKKGRGESRNIQQIIFLFY